MTYKDLIKEYEEKDFEIEHYEDEFFRPVSEVFVIPMEVSFHFLEDKYGTIPMDKEAFLVERF